MNKQRISGQDENVQILMVEDDAVEVRAFRRAMKRLKLSNEVISAGDGIEALEILRGEHPAKDLRHPFIILLDLNMPRMNGLEFLEELRASDDLANSVVFILSTSGDRSDRHQTYLRGISGYLVKAKDDEEIVPIVRMLHQFWSTVRLPILPKFDRN